MTFLPSLTGGAGIDGHAPHCFNTMASYALACRSALTYINAVERRSSLGST